MDTVYGFEFFSSTTLRKSDVPLTGSDNQWAEFAKIGAERWGIPLLWSKEKLRFAKLMKLTKPALPSSDKRAGTAAGNSLAHHFTPASLLTYAQAIFQASPLARVISVAGASFAYHEQLTPSVEKALPQVIQHVREQIARLQRKPEKDYA